ncbi:hypothetical protein VPH35_034406 [Triticum aestivum]
MLPSIQTCTSRVNVKFDSPPSRSASLALPIAAVVRSRSTLPPSESINHLTFAATSSASTTSVSYPSTATARPSSSSRNTLFIRCSAYSGQASMGTPAMTASSTEFHPQCVTKPPTAPCASTSRCGAHDLTTRPVALVRSRKPSGRSASRSGSGGSSNLFAGSLLGGLRTTHRNLLPLASRPMATCLICSALNTPRLPKQRNTTLAVGCASSHARHSWPRFTPTSSDFISGPMQ